MTYRKLMPKNRLMSSLVEYSKVVKMVFVLLQEEKNVSSAAGV